MATEKRLIDAIALTRRFKVRGCFKKDMLGCMVAQIINTAPTVDAVEVVRCEDCKNRFYSCIYHTYFCRNPRGIRGVVVDNDFCSYGERRTDV